MIGLIGCGHWGKNILKVLKKCDINVVVCDVNLNDSNTIKDYRQLLNNPSIDKIIIALPSNMHYNVAKEALIANKDVFVEKPASIILEEIIELIDLAKTYNRILMTGHILHFNSRLTYIKNQLSNKVLGNIKKIITRRHSFGKFDDYANVLWSIGIHDISYILSLPIGKIRTFDKKVYNFRKQMADIFDIEIKTSLDIEISISVNWLSPIREQSIIIYCDNGILYCDDVNKICQMVHYDGNRVDLSNEDDILPLDNEINHFIECCQNRIEPVTSLEKMLPVYKLLSEIDNNNNRNIFVHSSAFIDSNIRIGDDSKIWHNCHLSQNCIIGQNCNLGQNVYIGNDVKIGDNCRLQNNVNVYSGAIIGNNVFLGPNCIITNDLHPRIGFSQNGEYPITIIEDNVSIGAGAIIITGIKLGKGCFIGAGSVVTRNVEPYTMVYGNPARFISKIDETGNRINC